MSIKTRYPYLLIALASFLGEAAAQTCRPSGMNLAGVHDWSRERAFSNAFLTARPWIVHLEGAGAAWSEDIAPPLRADGYPTAIPFEDEAGRELYVRTILLTNQESRNPAGDYRLVVEGEGELRLWGAVEARVRTPVDTLINVPPVDESIYIELEASAPGDPIRNIRFLYPQFATMPLSEVPVFTPEILEFADDFQVIRYMDWTKTNNSRVTQWSERTPPTSYSQALKTGVAWEYVIAMANATETDAWICVPHLADDAYVDSLARLFARDLDPGRKVYLEYSNELWNRGFQQARDAQAAGAAREYPGRPWEQGWIYTGARSAEVFAAFSAGFPDTARLVKVLSTQGANPFVSRKIIEAFDDPTYNPNGLRADALSFAPYFGSKIGASIVERNAVQSVSIGVILDSLEASLEASTEQIVGQRAVAEEFGLRLVCYEAGQHLANPGNAVNDTTLTRKLIEANRHPRMRELYCRYLDTWYDGTCAADEDDPRAGGSNDLMCLFSSHDRPSQYGSWGIMEFMGDDQNPKYLALEECLFPYNTADPSTDVAESDGISGVVAFPNPTDGRLTLRAEAPVTVLRAFDALGREVTPAVSGLGGTEVSVGLDRGGVYSLRAYVRGAWVTQRVVVTQ